MPFVLVMCVACGSNGDKSDAYGNIETDEVLVSSEIGGRVVMLSVEEGGTVMQNQFVGMIDTVQLWLKRNQLEAQLSATKSKLAGIRSQANVQQEQIWMVQKEKNRVVNLLADSAATQRQLDDVEGRFNVATSQKRSIEIQKEVVLAEMASVRVQIDQLTDQIERCTVVSPINGTVLSKYVNQGEIAVAGRPLCKVARLDTLYARVYIDGSQLSQFAIGAHVTVLVDGQQGAVVENQGVISWIASEAEFTPKVIQTRNERADLVYAAKIRIANPQGIYKIGMPVEVRLNQ